MLTLRSWASPFWNLGWGDAEAAELRLALQYAAAKCAFPEGAVGVAVTLGNNISGKAMAKLPPEVVAPTLAVLREAAAQKQLASGKNAEKMLHHDSSERMFDAS